MNTFVRLCTIYTTALALTACASGKLNTSSPNSGTTALYTHSQDFTGWYVSSGTSKDKLVLHCSSNTACELQMVSVEDGKTSSNVKVYDNASPLEDTGQVEYAYEYAREHRNKPSTASSTDKELLEALEPLFKQANVEFKHCLDLDPNLPKYMVACKLTTSPWAKPTVIFFGTQLSDNCGAFCRFTLLPLHELTMEMKK